MLQTQKVIFPKIQSTINLRDEGTIEIENCFSLNVDFNEKKEECLATFTVSAVCKDHPDWFSVEVQALGIFSCGKTDNDAARKAVHTEAYDMLFPYMQSIIAELTTKAGVPPLMLDKINIDFSGIAISKK